MERKYHNMFRNLSQWKHSRLAGVLTRHGIILAVIALLGTGAIGGTILGVFAQGSCSSTDIAYHVSWGETLGSIAARYHTSVASLASYNHINNPNLIFAGQLVCIPSGGGPVSVAPQNNYVAIARQDASAVGISPDLFVRQINQESGFNPNAISYAGAIGIAQFMPGTAAALGINPYNPIQSLYGAARLMAGYARQYGNYAMALAAYNAGPGTVQYAVSVGGSNWMAYLPYETRNYIWVILG